LRGDEKSGPLTERDQAAVAAVRDQGAAGAVLLGSRGYGPVIEGTAREVVRLDERRAVVDRE
jgi:hypothetical protein